MIADIYQGEDISAVLTGVIGLWVAFVAGCGYGIALGVTWYSRMKRWAGKVVDHEAEQRGDGSGGPVPGVPAGGESPGVRSQSGVPGRVTRLREVPDDVRESA